MNCPVATHLHSCAISNPTPNLSIFTTRTMTTAAEPGESTNPVPAMDAAETGEMQRRPAHATEMDQPTAGTLLIAGKENVLPHPAGSSARKELGPGKNSQSRKAARKAGHPGGEALTLRIVDSIAAAPLESQEEAPAAGAGTTTPKDDAKRPAVERQESSHEYAATVS